MTPEEVAELRQRRYNASVVAVNKMHPQNPTPDMAEGLKVLRDAIRKVG